MISVPIVAFFPRHKHLYMHKGLHKISELKLRQSSSGRDQLGNVHLQCPVAQPWLANEVVFHLCGAHFCAKTFSCKTCHARFIPNMDTVWRFLWSILYVEAKWPTTVFLIFPQQIPIFTSLLCIVDLIKSFNNLSWVRRVQTGGHLAFCLFLFNHLWGADITKVERYLSAD